VERARGEEERAGGEGLRRAERPHRGRRV
jgi:hypothetical protein